MVEPTLNEGPARTDRWVGFGRWEAHRTLDPQEVRFDIYRGAVWRLAEIGKAWIAFEEAAWLVALVVLGFVFHALVASFVLLGAGLLATFWVQTGIEGWVEDHNARVEAAERGTKPRAPAVPGQDG